MKLEEVASNAKNRRAFLKGASIAGVGFASAIVLHDQLATKSQTVQAASYSDVEILNFALNLEYLEAEFYAMSTYGATLVELGVISAADTSGPTIGGNMIKGFGASPLAFLATGLRNDEIEHVQLLRSALGSQAVPKPEINLDAIGYGFINVGGWIALAAQFEEVGMSAYLGAAGFISSSANLATAAAILATEAQHAGALRLASIQNSANTPAVDSQDVPPTPQAPFDVDKNGLTISRAPSQVLKIVYAGGQSSGGFYPSGMNGSIVSQTS